MIGVDALARRLAPVGDGRGRRAVAPAGPAPTGAGLLGPVARGGLLNLTGAVVYGVANFALLLVLTRQLGVAAAGSVLVAIAIFNIVSRTAELGCSTGLIRWISRWRALDRPDRIRPTLVVAIVPVAVGSTVGAVVLVLAGGTLARVFAGADGADGVASVVRAMAPFLPVATIYSVVVGGTRGFGTMLPQVLVEKVGRGSALPLVVGLAAAAGIGVAGIGALWAATAAVALVPAAWAMHRLVRRALTDGGRTGDGPVPSGTPWRTTARDYWAYTAPRAVGQVSEVAVTWLDTVVVGALVSTAAAGVYAAGTRFLLPGLFIGEALMQVSAPVVSGLMVARRDVEATHLVQVVAAWGSLLVWPVYLLVGVFAPVLLRVFGPDVVAATGALRALSVALLVAAVIGPSHSVVLMSGRSRQAMFNTVVLLVVNLGANLWLVPRYGITAAGVAWAATIVVGAALPAWQADRGLGVRTVGAGALRIAACATVTVGTAACLAAVLLGTSRTALAVAAAAGTALFVPAVIRFGGLETAALFVGAGRSTSAPDGAGGSQ